MEKALVGLLFLFAFVFLDDIVVCGRTWKDFMHNLEAVFHRLAISGFKLKCTKTELGKKKITILGFQISSKGIELDPTKQRAASLWKTPTTQKECISFIQFANFMRRHIEKFSSIAKPLYDMCASKNFYWNQECNDAFELLKKGVVSAKALRLPDFKKVLYLTSDFCQKACAWSLLQREENTTGAFYAILYGSKSLSRTTYPSSKGELVSLKTAVVETRPYLHASDRFVVFTDHQLLTHLFKQRDISAFCLRMIEAISELSDFPLVHVPGTDKRIAIVDRLSRANLEVADEVTWSTVCGDKNVVSAVTTRGAARRSNDGEGQPVQNPPIPAPSDESFWAEAQGKDRDLVKVKRWLRDGKANEEDVSHCSPALRSYYMNFELFILTMSVIFRVWTVTESITRNLVVVPFHLIQQVLYEVHDLSGHVGETKSTLRLRERFFWYGMTKDIGDYIKSCEVCLRRKKNNAKAQLQPIFKSFFNEFLFIDVKVLTNYPAGTHSSILVMVEGFSKMVTLAALKSHESHEMMSKIWKKYICRFGAPLNIVSDREKGFLSKMAMEFYELLGIKKRSTVFHRPEADGQSESYVKIVSKIMSALLMTDTLDGQTDFDWRKRLPFIELAINSTPSTATNFSPYYIMCGRDMLVPSPLFMEIPNDRRTIPHSVRTLRRTQKQIYDSVLKTTDYKQMQTKLFYDKKTTKNPEKYEEGEQVLYRDYKSYSYQPPSFSSKFLPEVYTIKKRLGVNYMIENDGKSKVVHFNQLKKYVEQTEEEKENTRLRNNVSGPKRLGFNQQMSNEDEIE